MKTVPCLGRSLVLLGGLTALFSVSAFAQTPILETFRTELRLPVDQIGTNSTINVPGNVLSSIQGGALEIRQQMEYISATRLLRVSHILVPPGAPLPTPEGTQTGYLEQYFVRVSDLWVKVSAVPPGTNPGSETQISNPNTMIIGGSIENYTTESPFGARTGDRVVVALAYDPATNPARLGDVTLAVPGRYTTYVQNGRGTLAFQGETPGGGTPPGGGPVANAGPDLTTVSNDFLLNGSASTGTNLTYNWTVVSGSASLLNSNSATPRVQLAQAFGEYEFQLTVTDASGRTATDRVKVSYVGTDR